MSNDPKNPFSAAQAFSSARLEPLCGAPTFIGGLGLSSLAAMLRNPPGRPGIAPRPLSWVLGFLRVLLLLQPVSLGFVSAASAVVPTRRVWRGLTGLMVSLCLLFCCFLGIHTFSSQTTIYQHSFALLPKRFDTKKGLNSNVTPSGARI